LKALDEKPSRFGKEREASFWISSAAVDKKAAYPVHVGRSQENGRHSVLLPVGASEVETLIR